MKCTEDLIFIIAANPKLGVFKFNSCGIECPDPGNGDDVWFVDPDKLFGGQLILNAHKAALYHHPSVVGMDPDVFIESFNKMDLFQIEITLVLYRQW